VGSCARHISSPLRGYLRVALRGQPLANRRERRAIGTYVLGRERLWSWTVIIDRSGMESLEIEGEHSPALLSFRNVQNFAYTIAPKVVVAMKA
jgi:hypothetical protein